MLRQRRPDSKLNVTPLTLKTIVKATMPPPRASALLSASLLKSFKHLYIFHVQTLSLLVLSAIAFSFLLISELYLPPTLPQPTSPQTYFIQNIRSPILKWAWMGTVAYDISNLFGPYLIPYDYVPILFGFTLVNRWLHMRFNEIIANHQRELRKALFAQPSRKSAPRLNTTATLKTIQQKRISVQIEDVHVQDAHKAIMSSMLNEEKGVKQYLGGLKRNSTMKQVAPLSSVKVAEVSESQQEGFRKSVTDNSQYQAATSTADVSHTLNQGTLDSDSKSQSLAKESIQMSATSLEEREEQIHEMANQLKVTQSISTGSRYAGLYAIIVDYLERIHDFGANKVTENAILQRARLHVFQLPGAPAFVSLNAYVLSNKAVFLKHFESSLKGYDHLRDAIVHELFEAKTKAPVADNLMEHADHLAQFIASNNSVSQLMAAVQSGELANDLKQSDTAEASVSLTAYGSRQHQSFKPFMISDIPQVEAHYVKSQIFVRESYVGLIQTILKYGLGQPVCVSGDPGIGKSFLSLLLFFVLVRMNENVVRTSLSGFTLRYSKDDQRVVYEMEPSADWLRSDCWLLMDGQAELKPFSAKTHRAVVFSSPKQSNYHEFLKMDGLVLFMPAWTLDEVLALVNSFSESEIVRLGESMRREFDEYNSVDLRDIVLKTVRRRFEIVGGKVRLLLHIGVTSEDLKNDLQRKCGTLRMKDFAAPHDIDIQGSIPNLLYSVTPIGKTLLHTYGIPFGGKSVDFCSKLALETILDNVCMEVEDFTTMLYLAAKDAPIAVALADHLFKMTVHTLFEKGAESDLEAKKVYHPKAIQGSSEPSRGKCQFVKRGREETQKLLEISACDDDVS
ncbi:hypothetical protein HDV05_000692 [Chytridiales sp. JEL 0842]|nr:hypothetical protein HDV05_000692 [Chytridiales sp. JEL 0842]